MRKVGILALVLALWASPLPATVVTFDDHSMATMDAQGDVNTGTFSYHTIYIVHNGSSACTVTLQVESKTFFSYVGLQPGDASQVPLNESTPLTDVTLSASCTGVLVTLMWTV